MRGKDQGTTTLGDTIVNQLSNTSSRVSIHCTNFTNFEKRKRPKQKPLILQAQTNLFNSKKNGNGNDKDHDDNINKSVTINTKFRNSISSSQIFVENKNSSNMKTKFYKSHNDIKIDFRQNVREFNDEKRIKLHRSFSKRSLSSNCLEKVKTDYELSVISTGKSVLIRTNSYRSNIV